MGALGKLEAFRCFLMRRHGDDPQPDALLRCAKPIELTAEQIKQREAAFERGEEVVNPPPEFVNVPLARPVGISNAVLLDYLDDHDPTDKHKLLATAQELGWLQKSLSRQLPWSRYEVSWCIFQAVLNSESVKEESNVTTRAREELDRRRLSGERFTSRRKLAEELGCCKTTIHDAIASGSVELQEWGKKITDSCVPQLVTDGCEQRRERDPADVSQLDEVDVDVAMAYLIHESTTPEQRRQLEEMGPEQRRQMARTVYENPEHSEAAESFRQMSPARLRKFTTILESDPDTANQPRRRRLQLERTNR